MQTKGKKGFTLLEVLVVVLIAVLVTLFAVPAYKKSQDKNRYLAASGVLMDLANAVRMTLEEYPTVNTGSVQVTKSAFTTSDLGDALTVAPNGNLVVWMFQNQYFNEFPLDNSNKYMGYSYAVSTAATIDTPANCGNSCAKTNAIACMSGNNANTQFTCAWVDKSGILHHN